MKYTTLLIDADETILDFSKAEHEAFFIAMESRGVRANEEIYKQYSAINLALWKAYERGEIDKSVIPTRRFEQLYERLSIPGDPIAAAEAFVSALTLQGHLLHGARDFLEEACRSFDLYAVTNGIQSVQKGRFAKADINRYFKGVFISEEIGYGKPDARYFDYVLEHVNEKDKNRILVIGDSLTSDVLGAHNAGLDSVWLNVRGAAFYGEIEPTYTVPGFEELYGVIGQ